jgi:deoxyribodipyrimidine photo-lyase
MIDAERIESLNNAPIRDGRYVLYWMQASQRVRFNHALQYAVREANERGLPVVVCFGLMDDYPEANERHYAFLLEGLRDVERALRDAGIAFVVRKGQPADAALAYARDAAMVICDRGYLRHQRAWRLEVARGAACQVVQVESDVVVPVEVVTDKEQYAARTIRPRINQHRARFLTALQQSAVKHASLKLKLAAEPTVDVSDVDAALAGMKIDRSVKRVATYIGGEQEAQRLLEAFVSSTLAVYAEQRNEPADNRVSHMSPYLHFGQISPIDIAMRVQRSGLAEDVIEPYLEELIVRRELSMNFVLHNPRYDTYDCLPDWAKLTLRQHARDVREYVYTREQLEQAQTHDAYWNAAQIEMVSTGKMHNYMRMYWGKKIIEWTASPQEAFDIALELNNKYQLDGRDANSFTGVAWCFGKHDRPWTERAIFGTVRYMNAGGLKRKFDIDAYVRKVMGDGGTLFE